MAQWEWAIMLVIAIVGLLVELVSVRRSIARARQTAPAGAQARKPVASGPVVSGNDPAR